MSGEVVGERRDEDTEQHRGRIPAAPVQQQRPDGDEDEPDGVEPPARVVMAQEDRAADLDDERYRDQGDVERTSLGWFSRSSRSWRSAPAFPAFRAFRARAEPARRGPPIDFRAKPPLPRPPGAAARTTTAGVAGNKTVIRCRHTGPPRRDDDQRRRNGEDRRAAGVKTSDRLIHAACYVIAH